MCVTCRAVWWCGCGLDVLLTSQPVLSDLKVALNHDLAHRCTQIIRQIAKTSNILPNEKWWITCWKNGISIFIFSSLDFNWIVFAAMRYTKICVCVCVYCACEHMAVHVPTCMCTSEDTRLTSCLACSFLRDCTVKRFTCASEWRQQSQWAVFVFSPWDFWPHAHHHNHPPELRVS